MSKRIRLMIPLLVALFLLATAAANAESTSRKIVVFRAGVDAAAQRGAIQGVGGNSIKSLRLVNATVANLAPAAAAALARRAGVVRVEDDALAHAIAPAAPATAVPDVKPDRANGGKPKPTPTPAPQVTPWGITRIHADEAWGTSTGTGVKVAVIDTGISTSHPDLVVAGGVNEVNPAKSFNDDNGHGSHVAGIIAAKDNSLGVVGVAPDASLYAVKVLDRNGSGWVSDIIAGLDWSVANGMQVANMSLGTSSDVTSFHEAIISAYAAGLTIVAAAGNSGPASNSVEYPAKYSEVLAISAIDSSNSIASWSSNGPEVDLAAPGVSIYSTYKGSGYTTLSGTSMAAPHVTGTVALRLQIDTDKSPSHIASILKDNATWIQKPNLSSGQQGAGMVDAYKVVTAN